MDSSRPVLGLIPARGGSKGIPEKNLRLLAGRPLIEYTCRAALGSRSLDRIIVSTDCPRIAEVARGVGTEVPFLRPAHLAGDRTPMVDVVRHALGWLAARERFCPEMVVLLQPTAPLRGVGHIDEAVALLRAGGGRSVVSVTRLPAHYHPAWQFVVRGGQLDTFTGTPLAQLASRRQDLSPTYTRNGAVYGFYPRVLEATGSLYGTRCLAYVMPAEVSVNIDTMADWERAETLLRNRPVEVNDAA